MTRKSTLITQTESVSIFASINVKSLSDITEPTLMTQNSHTEFIDVSCPWNEHMKIEEIKTEYQESTEVFLAEISEDSLNVKNSNEIVTEMKIQYTNLNEPIAENENMAFRISLRNPLE